MKFKLVKPWFDGQPRPWRYLPFWEWTLHRDGFKLWINRSRLVTDAEFRQVIYEELIKPPSHFNCRCTAVPII